MQNFLPQAYAYSDWVEYLNLSSVADLDEAFLQCVMQGEEVDQTPEFSDDLYLACTNNDVYHYDWQTENITRLPFTPVDGFSTVRFEPLANHLLFIEEGRDTFRITAFDGQNEQLIFDKETYPVLSNTDEQRFILQPMPETNRLDLIAYNVTDLFIT